MLDPSKPPKTELQLSTSNTRPWIEKDCVFRIQIS